MDVDENFTLTSGLTENEELTKPRSAKRKRAAEDKTVQALADELNEDLNLCERPKKRCTLFAHSLKNHTIR